MTGDCSIERAVFFLSHQFVELIVEAQHQEHE
jgi:hypothetical protein